MKTENKKTLRGSVLFTVVCVMALLIIFLTGTLALASASSNRAHKSYSSSQASYTARAAIDTFVQSMERNPGIPAAIEDMGEAPLEVEMEISDRTLGVLGYYDKDHKWQENKIVITPVADSDGYIFSDITPDGVDNPEWIKVTAVKVTATCRVGREEETVSAYIQKSGSSHSEVTPGGLDGLQEVGANAFPNGGYITGGFGLGISKDASGLFPAHNQTTIETKLSFINGSMVSGTSDFVINVKTPTDKDAKKERPYSQTVIMGNLYIKDGSAFIRTDYTMQSDYTQKDIPYLYIDGAVAGDGGSMNLVTDAGSKVDGKGKAPFNVFIGTLDCTKGKDNGNEIKLAGADLYLMDSPSSEKYRVMYAERNYALEETFYELDDFGNIKLDAEGNPIPADKRLQADQDKDVKNITKGENYFGTAKGKSLLYDWTSSYVHKAESQHKSTGGNIYSMGNLTLQNAQISGDVRVDKDCHIKNGVKIEGDLVVKGHLYFDGGSLDDITGTIYCDNVHNVASEKEADQLKPGYQEHVNELVDGYTEIPNAIFDNDEVPESSYEIRKARQDASYIGPDGNNWYWGIQYPPDTTDVTVFPWGDPRCTADYSIYVIGDQWFESKPYYATKNDGTVDYDKIVESAKSIYKVNPSDPSEILDVETDEEMSYYKLREDGSIGDAADKSDAIRTFYTDPSGAVVSKADAFEKVTVGTASPYTGCPKAPAYPLSMTREAIYGYFDESGQFQVNGTTKLIKNIYEVREDLNMDQNGEYKKDVYFDHVPKKFSLNASNDAYIDDPKAEGYNGNDPAYADKLPYAYLPNGHKNDDNISTEDKNLYKTEDADSPYKIKPWNGGKIVQSCIIGNPDRTSFEIEKKTDCNIVGSGEGIWIVLRNIHTEADGDNDFFCDTSKGKVCFLIDGSITFNNSVIVPTVTGGGVNEYKEGCLVTPDSTWNIEYYGKPGSSINLGNGGGSTLVGTFMCPETSFSGKVAGKWGCNYRGAYTAEGSEEYKKSPIVGSALFKNITEAQNDFAVLNSGGGGASKDTKKAVTALGTSEISYFMGS